MLRFLDPRFRMIAALIDDPNTATSMRETALQHAEAIAAQCGYAFEEAMAKAGLPLPSDAIEDLAPASVHAADEDEEYADHAADPPTDEEYGDDTSPAVEDPPVSANEEAPTGQIAAALQADPTRADRDIARECGASPTTVGKARLALGLGKAVRSVMRGGKPYEMTVGDRS